MVDEDVGDHRAVLAVRAVDADGVGIGRAGEDRIGLRHRGDVEDVGARQHRLHGERHRAVPALDHHGDLLGHHLVGARDADRRRALVVLGDDHDLAAQHAALGIDHLGRDRDGMGHALAVGTGRAGQRKDDADLDRLALGQSGEAERRGTGGRSDREMASPELDRRHDRFPINDRLFRANVPCRRVAECQRDRARRGAGIASRLRVDRGAARSLSVAARSGCAGDGRQAVTRLSSGIEAWSRDSTCPSADMNRSLDYAGTTGE